MKRARLKTPKSLTSVRRSTQKARNRGAGFKLESLEERTLLSTANNYLASATRPTNSSQTPSPHITHNRSSPTLHTTELVIATASVTGEVFNDLPGSGSFVAGDPGLGGWTINLLNASDATVATAVTNSSGDYSFSNVPSGTYTVSEELQNEWIQTFPASPGTYTFTVTSGQNVSGQNFGAFQLVTFSGEVYNDLNGNGVNDPGDPGLQGWTVDLRDSLNNLVATVTSAQDGTYSFANLGPGGYTIEELSQAGWDLTEPANPTGTYTVQAMSGTNSSGLDFGNFQFMNVIGLVYNDSNGNGNLDPAETGLQGWTVLLLNAAGDTVATVTSDQNGDYEFANLFPGTFTVEEIPPPGWVQTQPVNPNYYQFTTQSGLNEAGLNFGNFKLATFSGNVFDDLNGNGVQDKGDVGLPTWVVDLVNPNGNVLASTVTSKSGNYSFTGIGPGTFTVAEVVKPGWYQTTHPTTYSVQSTSGATVSGLTFGDKTGAAPAAVLGGPRAIGIAALPTTTTGLSLPRFYKSTGKSVVVVTGVSLPAPVKVVYYGGNMETKDQVAAAIHGIFDTRKKVTQEENTGLLAKSLLGWNRDA